MAPRCIRGYNAVERLSTGQRVRGDLTRFGPSSEALRARHAKGTLLWGDRAMRCLLGVLIVAVSLAGDAYCSDRQAALPQSVKVTVEMTDGSRIVGRPSRETLRLRTALLGRVWVPYRRMKSAQPVGDGQWVVHTADGDTLRGELIDAEFSLETAFGRMYVPARHVRRLTTALGPKGVEEPAVRNPAEPAWIQIDPEIGAGKFGLRFDGVDDFVAIPPSPHLDIRGSVTLSAWVRGDGDVEGQIIWRGDTRRGADPYMLHLVRGKMEFRVDSTGTNVHYVRSRERLDDRWHFWTGVCDDEQGRIFLYKDGELEGSAAVEHESKYDSSAMWNMVGAANYGERQRFRGSIGEVRIWNVARSADEIRRDMGRRLKGRERGLAALWTFEEGRGSVANDVTLNCQIGYLGWRWNPRQKPLTGGPVLYALRLLPESGLQAMPEWVWDSKESREYRQEIEQNALVLTVPETDRLMKWYTRVLRQPVDPGRFPTLAFKYRAERLRAGNTAGRPYADWPYVIYLFDGRGGYGGFTPVHPAQIVSDGKWHEMVVDLRRFRPAGPIREMAFQVWASQEGGGLLEIKDLRFTGASGE